MISFEKYRRLPQNLQAEVLWERGVYLGLVRKSGRLSMELYALHGFYVEVVFRQETGDPLRLDAFNDTEGLEPYLDQVCIGRAFAIR